MPAAVPYAIPGSGWLIDPPEGLRPAKDEAGQPYWLRVTQESVSVGERRLSVKSVESITASIEDEEWRQGLPWPQDCRRANNLGNAILSGRVAMGLFDGTPAFKTPRPALIRERARHVGDPLALVVAETPAQAADGAAHMVVEYEPMSAVAGAAVARRPGAPAALPCLGEIAMSHVYEVPAEFARKARVTAC